MRYYLKQIQGKELKMDYFTEIKKLALGLLERQQPFEFKKIYEGYQIWVVEDDCTVWDAICHGGSYGHEKGLLELMGYKYTGDDDVEGDLTAEEILRRYDNKHGKNN